MLFKAFYSQQNRLFIETDLIGNGWRKHWINFTDCTPDIPWMDYHPIRGNAGGVAFAFQSDKNVSRTLVFWFP